MFLENLCYENLRSINIASLKLSLILSRKNKLITCDSITVKSYIFAYYLILQLLFAFLWKFLLFLSSLLILWSTSFFTLRPKWVNGIRGVSISFCTWPELTGSSLVAQMVKNLPEIRENLVQSLGWKDPLEREWLPTPELSLQEFHGQRNLVVCIHGVEKNWTWLSD